MNQNDIIRIAREAGVAGVTVWSEKEQAYVLRPELEWFASFVAAAERERVISASIEGAIQAAKNAISEEREQ